MMNLFNETKTDNGAITYESTGNPLMDINYLLTRDSSQDFIDIILKKNRDKVSAIHYLASILLYRDCREGKGERRLALEMMKARPAITAGLLEHLPSFGRWKDLVDLMDCNELRDECVRILCKQLQFDLANPDDSTLTLVGKWMPSSNAGKTARAKAKIIRKALGWKEAEYRKNLSKLRSRLKVVETMLTKKQHIDISKIPSLSLFKNYSQLIQLFPDQFEKLNSGEKTVNTNVNQPHEFIKSLERESMPTETLDTLWDSYLKAHSANLDILPVIDVSGSMEILEGNTTPLHHALGLGIYCANNNKGKWKDKVLTFSSSPKCLDIEGHSLHQAVSKINSWENAGYSTDIEATLKLIADNCSSQEEVPSTLALFSDMEFNQAVEYPEKSPIASGEAYFKEKGLKPPQIIFWNLGANGRVPVADCKDYIMFNGSSPILLESFMAGEIKEAYEILMNTLSPYIMYIIIHI